MDRRAFLGILAGSLLAAPLGAEGQQAGKPYRIGVLLDVAAPINPLPNFRSALNNLGYVEGQDFVMEYRWTVDLDRLPELAADLVRAKVDVIVTAGPAGIRAAKQATKTIPIVFAASSQVVESGFVESLARPGGNVMGITFQVQGDKGLELLKEAVPTLVRVGYLYDPGVAHEGPSTRAKMAARALNLTFQPIAVRDHDEVARAFAKFERGTNGLMIQNSSLLLVPAGHVCGLALQRRLPTITFGRTFAEAGCLMSLGENLADMYRRAAWFVDKILKGAKPADLPVEQPTKIELVINLKTAKALGLTIPPSLLARADQVIE
jgi:putative tryptophan/tyrosine transport system substrate-binding protein